MLWIHQFLSHLILANDVEFYEARIIAPHRISNANLFHFVLIIYQNFIAGYSTCPLQQFPHAWNLWHFFNSKSIKAFMAQMVRCNFLNEVYCQIIREWKSTLFTMFSTFYMSWWLNVCMQIDLSCSHQMI